MQPFIHHIETSTQFPVVSLANQLPLISSYPNWNNALKFSKSWINNQDVFSISTSGSTGSPKSIELQRSQMHVSAQRTIEALGLEVGSNLLVCLNTQFIAGQMMLVRGLVNDMNIYVSEPSSNPIFNIKGNINIDFTALVPLQIQQIIEQGGQALNKLNSMKAVIVGGAPISFPLLKQIEQLNAPVYATYGMTETVSHIALKKLNGVDKTDRFKVLKGVDIGQDTRGCITIKGEVTNYETVITNDIIDLIDGKNFVWLGRADNVINSGGIKIHPEQVESKISVIMNDLQLTNRFFITGRNDGTLGQRIILVIEGLPFDTSNLIVQMTDILGKYEIPKEITFVSQFVDTSTGKVNRNQSLSFDK